MFQDKLFGIAETGIYFCFRTHFSVWASIFLFVNSQSVRKHTGIVWSSRRTNADAGSRLFNNDYGVDDFRYFKQ